MIVSIIYQISEAVYSGELTGVVEEGTDNKSICGESYIQRLPYFVLVKRTHDKQNEQIEELKEQLDIVKKRLVIITADRI